MANDVCALYCSLPFIQFGWKNTPFSTPLPSPFVPRVPTARVRALVHRNKKENGVHSIFVHHHTSPNHVRGGDAIERPRRERLLSNGRDVAPGGGRYCRRCRQHVIIPHDEDRDGGVCGLG